jgi:hypothetical protein
MMDGKTRGRDALFQAHIAVRLPQQKKHPLLSHQEEGASNELRKENG